MAKTAGNLEFKVEQKMVFLINGFNKPDDRHQNELQ